VRHFVCQVGLKAGRVLGQKIISRLLFVFLAQSPLVPHHRKTSACSTLTQCVWPCGCRALSAIFVSRNTMQIPSLSGCSQARDFYVGNLPVRHSPPEARPFRLTPTIPRIQTDLNPFSSQKKWLVFPNILGSGILLPFLPNASLQSILFPALMAS